MNRHVAKRPQQVIQPVKQVVEEPKTVDFSFIKEGLQNFRRFTVSEINMDWIRERYSEWEKERKDNLQLTSDTDADAFLKSFYSKHSGAFWSEQYANEVFEPAEVIARVC